MSNYNCQACSKPMVEWVEVCVDCASKLEEPAPSASANTGSPKMPTLAEVQNYVEMHHPWAPVVEEREGDLIELVYDFICRQLRAGA